MIFVRALVNVKHPDVHWNSNSSPEKNWVWKEYLESKNEINKMQNIGATHLNSIRFLKESHPKNGEA